MLTGTLDDFTLPDVLRLIGSARRSGHLDVRRDAGSGRLSFHEGAVGPSRDAEDVLFDLMRWSDGDFSWEPGGTGPHAGDGISVEDLLEHVSRRLEELAQIKTLVPSEEAVLVMAPQPPEGAVQINITPAEWRVLVMVDGHRPVRDIAAAAGLDDVAAMRVLYGLATAGLVGLARPGGPPGVVDRAADHGPPQEASDMTDMTDVTDMTDMSAVSDTSWAEVVHAATHPRPDAETVAGEVEPAAEPASGAPMVIAGPEPEPEATTEPEPEPDAAAEPELLDPFLEEDPAPEPPADPFLEEDPAAEPPAAFPATFDAPPFGDAPEVDRSTAARELAGLFDDAGGGFGSAETFVAAPPAPPRPRRLEDDDQVTRGLISRLIDGVKGL